MPLLAGVKILLRAKFFFIPLDSDWVLRGGVYSEEFLDGHKFQNLLNMLKWIKGLDFNDEFSERI